MQQLGLCLPSGEQGGVGGTGLKGAGVEAKGWDSHCVGGLGRDGERRREKWVGGECRELGWGIGGKGIWGGGSGWMEFFRGGMTTAAPAVADFLSSTHLTCFADVM